MADSAVSWCAAVSLRGTPDPSSPIVYRTGPGFSIDIEAYMDAYFWIGMPLDPFKAGKGPESSAVIRDSSEFAESGGFEAIPFATRYLRRFGLGSRTVLYLRDRGIVKSILVLDRVTGSSGLTSQENLRLLKLAPLLEQTLTCGDLLESAGVTPRSTHLNGIDSLTSREVQITRMIARGLNNDEVAQELVLSVGTVKTHLGNIYRKTDVRTRAELVSLALNTDALGNHATAPPRRVKAALRSIK